VLIAGVCLFSSKLVISQNTKQGAEHPLAKVGQPIAGIPYEEALAIFDRHIHELQNLPGVASVSFTADGLVVTVRDPSVLPATVEGLPVIGVPPVDPWATRTIDGSTPVPPRESAEIPSLPPPPDVDATPSPDSPSKPAQECGSEAHWDSQAGRCRRNTPLSVPSRKFPPPPPGVVVLKSGGIREQKESCPSSFEEVTEYGGWRFCVDPTRPEPIPPLWEPPIADIPYEEAVKILDRHQDELMKLQGVGAVGMGMDGIEVETNNPAAVPTAIEGLPIKVLPLKPAEFFNHTRTQAEENKGRCGFVGLGDLQTRSMRTRQKATTPATSPFPGDRRRGKAATTRLLIRAKSAVSNNRFMFYILLKSLCSSRVRGRFPSPLFLRYVQA
jgi:hypothetical protein